MALEWNGNGARPPLSAAANGATSASTAAQTLGIFAVIPDPTMAAMAALAWAVVAGAVAKVSRDELHAIQGKDAGVWRRIALTIGSALG